MNQQTIDLMTEYNTKVLESMRTLGDMNVKAAQNLIGKQIEVSQKIIDSGLKTSKSMASAKTPTEALETSAQMIQGLSETMGTLVKETSESAVKMRDELKSVIDDAIQFNTEFSAKAMKNGIEITEKATKKNA